MQAALFCFSISPAQRFKGQNQLSVGNRLSETMFQFFCYHWPEPTPADRIKADRGQPGSPPDLRQTSAGSPPDIRRTSAGYLPDAGRSALRRSAGVASGQSEQKFENIVSLRRSIEVFRFSPLKRNAGGAFLHFYFACTTF